METETKRYKYDGNMVVEFKSYDEISLDGRYVISLDDGGVCISTGDGVAKIWDSKVAEWIERFGHYGVIRGKYLIQNKEDSSIEYPIYAIGSPIDGYVDKILLYEELIKGIAWGKEGCRVNEMKNFRHHRNVSEMCTLLGREIACKDCGYFIDDVQVGLRYCEWNKEHSKGGRCYVDKKDVGIVTEKVGDVIVKDCNVGIQVTPSPVVPEDSPLGDGMVVLDTPVVEDVTEPKVIALEEDHPANDVDIKKVEQGMLKELDAKIEDDKKDDVCEDVLERVEEQVNGTIAEDGVTKVASKVADKLGSALGVADSVITVGKVRSVLEGLLRLLDEIEPVNKVDEVDVNLTEKEKYVIGQGKCGIKYGDRVLVKSKAVDTEKGWNNIWNSDMNRAIGNVYKVVGVCGTNGILLNDGYTYPWFVLEVVTDK